jgi:CheY-like chemotaxis protein
MHIQIVPSGSVDVLIVEDDGLTRQALRLLLEQGGYRCAEVEDGREALALARAQPPRCVLLDLLLPGLDGFAVTRRLRADPRTVGAHIHCLTGLRDQLIQEQAYRAGCDAFLTKPVDGLSLLEVIGRRLQETRVPPATVVSGLSKREAEDLLDWLENHGCTELSVTIEAGGFAVRCLCPPGLHLVQHEGRGVRLWRPAPGQSPDS